MKSNKIEAFKLLGFIVFLVALAMSSETGMNLIVFVTTISFLVFIHELGHYIWFKRAGIKIDTFSIGMWTPVAVLTFKNGEKWQFCPLLIGGFVSPQGMNKKFEAPREKGDYWSSTPLGRLKAVLAGPVVNIVFALIFFTVAFMLPQDIVTGTNRVESVAEHSFAANNGVMPGDKIVSIGGTPTNDATSILEELSKTEWNTPTIVKVESPDGEVRSILLLIDASDRLGVNLEAVATGVKSGASLVDASAHAAKVSVTIIPDMFANVGKIFSGDGELAGPAKFGSIVAESHENSGLYGFLTIMAALSLMLGVFNLIPLLPLDGGHVITTLYEMAAKKPVPARAQTIMTWVVGLPLFGLTIIWLLWDIIEKFI